MLKVEQQIFHAYSLQEQVQQYLELENTRERFSQIWSGILTLVGFYELKQHIFMLLTTMFVLLSQWWRYHHYYHHFHQYQVNLLSLWCPFLLLCYLPFLQDQSFLCFFVCISWIISGDLCNCFIVSRSWIPSGLIQKITKQIHPKRHYRWKIQQFRFST